MSGRGFLRNFDNTTEGIIPEVYKTLASENPEDGSTHWHPDIVFVNLGTNDFSTGIPDSAAFTQAVYDFTAGLRAKYPSAAIVLLNGPMMSGESMTTCRRYLDAVTDQLKAAIDKNIYRFDFEPQGALGFGGGYHPNKAQGRKDGESLAAWIQKTFHW